MERKVDRASMSIMDEFSEKVRKENVKEHVIKTAPLMVLAALIIVFAITCGASFVSKDNLVSIMNQLAIPLVVALGLTFVIMIGSIDLSINGSVGMAGSLMSCFVLNSLYPNMNMGLWGVMLAVMASVVCGFVIGVIHVKLHIPSFMVTFAFMYICKGIGMLSYQGLIPTIRDPLLVDAAKASFIGIPFITWVAVALFAMCYYIQEYTAFGRHIYAVGTNENVPRSVGVNVDMVKIKVFTLAALLFGIAGIIGTIRLGQGQVGVGEGLMFPAQAAVVVGGTALSGGKGGVLNTVTGVLIMTILNNGLVLLSVNPFIRTALSGVIILVAVILTIQRSNQIISK
jgi:ribose transport system permease protein